MEGTKLIAVKIKDKKLRIMRDYLLEKLEISFTLKMVPMAPVKQVDPISKP